jgi:phage recombination protein Bet
MSTELEVRSNSGALAVGGEQAHWTEQQVAVLRSLGVDKEVSPAELDGFLHECQRTKLDPFTRQIYLIGRYDSQAKRKVYRSQTGIDGYRVIANRVIREENAELEYEDPLWCGPDGIWQDVWLGANPPAAAKVVVLKNGKRFPGVATLAEYAARYSDGNPYPMWKKMPSNQLSKCAEALALRRAFPQDLEGIYTAEEMEQADAEEQTIPPLGEHPADAAIAAAGQTRRVKRSGKPAEDEWTLDKPPAERIAILFDQKLGITDRPARLAAIGDTIGRKIESSKDLFYDEANRVIDGLVGLPDRPEVHDKLLADLFAGIEGAPGHAELESLGRQINGALQGNRLTETDRGLLAAAWEERKTALGPVPEMAGAST